jgi:hypothetical protein
VADIKDMILCTGCCRRFKVGFQLGPGGSGLPDVLAAPGGTCRLCGEAFTGHYALITRERRNRFRAKVPATDKTRAMDEYERSEAPYLVAPTPDDPYPFLRRVRGPLSA